MLGEIPAKVVGVNGGGGVDDVLAPLKALAISVTAVLKTWTWLGLLDSCPPVNTGTHSGSSSDLHYYNIQVLKPSSNIQMSWGNVCIIKAQEYIVQWYNLLVCANIHHLCPQSILNCCVL